jgi:hypothetical protein
MGTAMQMAKTPRTYPEWLDLQPRSPLRQGDVLQTLSSDPDRWRELLVILTADCDLAKSKHGGALTCVPLLKSTDYLLLFRAEKLRNQLCARLVAKLLEIYGRAAGGESSPAQISSDRMRAWIAEESDIGTLGAILGLTGSPAVAFESAARCVRTLLVEEQTSVEDAIRVLGNAKFILGAAGTQERATKSIANDVTSCLKGLPGDALFLNQVSPTHVESYVAYLRRVVEVDEASVVVTTSLLPREAQYLRVSRLQSPYVYALTQQFASVFSSIGLPEEYESARDATIDRLRMMEEVS